MSTVLESYESYCERRAFGQPPARIAVIDFLEGLGHPSTYSEELVKTGFEKSTIFRDLRDLTEAGVLRKMELGDHV